MHRIEYMIGTLIPIQRNINLFIQRAVERVEIIAGMLVLINLIRVGGYGPSKMH